MRSDGQLRLPSPAVGIRRAGLARALRWTAAGLFALGFLVFSALGGGASWAYPLSVLIALVNPLSFVAMALWATGVALSGWTPSRAGTLVVQGDAAAVERPDGATRVLEGAVTEGWLLPTAQGLFVELEAHDGDVATAQVADGYQGHVVLDAAGVDASRRAMRFALGNTFSTALLAIGAPLGASVVIAALLGATRLPAGLLNVFHFALTAAVVLLALWDSRPSELSVGGDGVALRHPFRAQLIAYSDMAGVQSLGSAISITLRSGAVVTVPTYDEARSARIVARIQEAASGAARRAGSSAPVALLDRNGRSYEDWFQALRELVGADGGQHYRQYALSRQDVEAVLEDPTTTPERRIAAAVALASLGDPQAGVRIRVAADACASEPVRVALEKAVEGGLDAVEVDRALAMAEAERVRR